MSTMGPTELLEDTTDLLVGCLEARRMSLLLKHKTGNGDFRHKINRYEEKAWGRWSLCSMAALGELFNAIARILNLILCENRGTEL